MKRREAKVDKPKGEREAKGVASEKKKLKKEKKVREVDEVEWCFSRV